MYDISNKILKVPVSERFGLVVLYLLGCSLSYGSRIGGSLLYMKRKITNRLGLPAPIVKAVTNDPYDAGDSDFTITGLLKPPRMVQLSKYAEVVTDAGDRLYSLQGQIMHHILERAGKELAAEGYIVEKRFYTTYVVDGKIYRVSVQIDLFDPAKGILQDYKYTSVGAAKKGLKEDHRFQLNFQAEVLRRNGFQVDLAEVVLLLRDWSAERTYEGYPESPCIKQVVKLMSKEEVDAWVVERIVAHEAAKVSLPLCTDEERWSRPTFAVMKTPTAVRATRVFDNRTDADDFIAAKGGTVVERPGRSIRCMRYCDAKSVCEQAKAILGDEESTPEVGEDGMMKVS